MKNLIVAGLVLSLISCESASVKNSNIDKFECINKSADASFTKADIQQKISGNWQLEQVITMLPTQKAPNLELRFKDQIGTSIDKQVAEVYLDGKKINTLTCTLVETSVGNITTVSIQSESSIFDAGNKSFSEATIRICNDAMLIDYGMAFDAPAYMLLKK